MKPASVATDSMSFVHETWQSSIVPTLTEYIRIPNKSPMFDSAWKANGHMQRATKLIESWCRAQKIPGLTVEVVEHGERTPIIFMEVPPTRAGDTDTVLLYGHLDKQPEMTGWSEGLGPWSPVLRGDKLYGRGGADDGYAAFASLTAIAALHRAGVPHARLVVIIEASEESGSPDLPHYIDALAARIGSPSLVVCLDSGCGNYDQLWTTTSLRGLVGGTLSVSVLNEGVHSGDASGIVPSSFRIARMLISRIEDEATGQIKLPSLHGDIPTQRREQAQASAKIIGQEVYGKFPLVGGMKPVTNEVNELILNRTWRPALSVTGAAGLPALENAGNVLRPGTQLKLSLRLPPNIDADRALALLKQTLEKDPPYGAKVSFEGEGSGGWDAPPAEKWLLDSIAQASEATFGRPAAFMGEGGTIPFMGMLGQKFPKAQFLITGVLGPQSNAHGPNEFLHLPTGEKLTACVAQVLAQHHERAR